jgi:hypothetical protein
MACPYCNSEEWKLASLVHLEGISEIRSKTKAHGVEVGTLGIGLGLGGAKTNGYQQSMLSKAAAPPKSHHPLTISLAIALFLSFVCASSRDFLLFDIGILTLCAAGISFVYPRERQKNVAAMTAYTSTRMCQRCGHFYRPIPLSEDEIEPNHNQTDACAKFLALLAMILIAIAAFVVLAHKQDSQSGKQTSLQSSAASEEPTLAESTVREDINRYHLYKTKIGEAIYLRKLFNDYLAGSIGQTNEDNRSSQFALLDKWDKSYYQSKFYVLLVEKAPMGGNLISILFHDKPDKIFVAWVYTLSDGGYELRGLDSAGLTEEEVAKVIDSVTNSTP